MVTSACCPIRVPCGKPATIELPGCGGDARRRRELERAQPAERRGRFPQCEEHDDARRALHCGAGEPGANAHRRCSQIRSCSAASRGSARLRGRGAASGYSATMPPAAHHHDAVGEHERLGDAVRDEEHRLAARRPDAQQLVLHLDAGDLVERAERLVHQQDLRILRERARDRDALLHAAGELGRIPVAVAGEPDERQELGRLAPARGGVEAAAARAELDVADRGEPGKERLPLEHDALAAPGPGDRRAVDEHLARARLHQPGDDVEERRLAAAAAADQGDELVLGDREVDAVQHRRAGGRRVVALRDRAQRDLRRRGRERRSDSGGRGAHLHHV